jgi:hypothetical protein
MKVFNYDVDGPVDLGRFDADWKFQRSLFQRSLSDFPPVKFSWQGAFVSASVESDNLPEVEMRNLLNFSLGPQGRRLK